MHEVAHVNIRIDRDPGTPAYRQIYRQIRHQIAAGSIPAGALIASIHEYPGDKVRIVGADAGLHILLAMARNATGPSSSTSRAFTTCTSTAPTAIGWETPAPCATSCWSDSRRSARRTPPRGYGASGGLVRLTCNGAAAARGHAPVKTREPQHPEGGGTLGRRERKLVFTN